MHGRCFDYRRELLITAVVLYMLTRLLWGKQKEHLPPPSLPLIGSLHHIVSLRWCTFSAWHAPGTLLLLLAHGLQKRNVMLRNNNIQSALHSKVLPERERQPPQKLGATRKQVRPAHDSALRPKTHDRGSLITGKLPMEILKHQDDHFNRALPNSCGLKVRTTPHKPNLRNFGTDWIMFWTS